MTRGKPSEETVERIRAAHAELMRRRAEVPAYLAEGRRALREEIRAAVKQGTVSQAEVGRVLGISRERVRQIVNGRGER